MRGEWQEGLHTRDIKTELASVPWIIRALQDSGIVTEIKHVVAGREHQDPMPVCDLSGQDLDSVEQKRKLLREGVSFQFDGEALIEGLGPKALRGDEFGDPAAILGSNGGELAFADDPLEYWRGPRLDLFKPVFEGYVFTLDLEVVEAFLGCGLPRRGLVTLSV